MPMPWIWCRRLCLALLMAVAGVLLDAPSTGLTKALAEDRADSTTHDPAVNPAVVLRQRSVEWDPRLFAYGIPDRIQLHLFDDCHFNAALLWSEIDPAGGLAWHGHIEDYPGSRVILVVHGARASALIQPDDRRFDLRPSADGWHVVQQIDGTALPAHVSELDAPACCAPTRVTASQAMIVQSAMGAEEATVLELVNQERSKYDRPPLAGDNRLTAAARAHSRDMSDNNYFSHTSQDGRTVGQRITVAGYSWNRCGENIARGYSSPEAVMLGWMNSDGHRSNILSADYCDLGVGYFSSGRYWTQNFGRRQGVRQCPIVSEEHPDEYTSPSAPTGAGSGGGCFVESVRRSRRPGGTRRRGNRISSLLRCRPDALAIPQEWELIPAETRAKWREAPSPLRQAWKSSPENTPARTGKNEMADGRVGIAHHSNFQTPTRATKARQ
jgi:uncharacterized protein YkwD